ncbi:MAG: HAD-IC family P-type ATPase, partial [bacterium]|nr:HAD-IC family P-type ATPase [bacterium]
RDGEDQSTTPDGVVLDDVLVISTGDQIVADGVIITDGGIELDESLLTGESDPVRKASGHEVHSGSYCVSGKALVRITRVGTDSFAASLTATARTFQAVKTPLQRLVDNILRMLITVAVFFGLLFLAQGIVAQDSTVRLVETATVTASVIPVGLFLIFAVTYSLSAARLADADILVQRLNAVESLSHVNVLCTDKTGTLTTNKIRLAEILPLSEASDLEHPGLTDTDPAARLATFAASAGSANATTQALIAGLDGQPTPVGDEVPFSSARKWSAATLDGGTYVLGAVEMVSPMLASELSVDEVLAEWTGVGRRVLLFAGNEEVAQLHDADGEIAVPALVPLALVGLTDELRIGAKETIEGLTADDVRLKVISGDNPDTVAALSRQVGLAGDLTLVSGPELANMSAAEFDEAVVRADIFGRIAPDQKEQVVSALQRRGDYVAMIGDGVNDTLALKTADVGIAMESGSSAARGVADLVLLNDSFSAVRPAIEEGRRVVNGMRDILRLTITRSVTLALVAIAVMIINQVFPFSPGAQTIYGLLTVTIPTFILALWATPVRATDVTVAQLARFIVPVSLANLFYGVAVFVGTYSIAINGLDGNVFSRLQDTVGFSLGADQATTPEVAAILGRTSLVVFLILTGLLTVWFLQPPHKFFANPGHPVNTDRRVFWLVISSVGLLIVFMSSGLRSWLELAKLPAWGYFTLGGMAIFWTVTLRFALQHGTVEKHLIPSDKT